MRRETLEELLAAAAHETCKGDEYRFSEQQDAAVLIAAEGVLLTVARVSKVVLRATHAVVEGSKETLHVDQSAVVAVRIETSPDGTGFIKG